MQLIEDAEPSRLTHIYTREWCNNFIPRRPVEKKRKEQPMSQQNIVNSSRLAARDYRRVLSPGIIIGRYRFEDVFDTSIAPFGATNGPSEIVSLARAKLRRGTSN